MALGAIEIIIKPSNHLILLGRHCFAYLNHHAVEWDAAGAALSCPSTYRSIGSIDPRVSDRWMYCDLPSHGATCPTCGGRRAPIAPPIMTGGVTACQSLWNDAKLHGLHADHIQRCHLVLGTFVFFPLCLLLLPASAVLAGYGSLLYPSYLSQCTRYALVSSVSCELAPAGIRGSGNEPTETSLRRLGAQPAARVGGILSPVTA